MPNQYLPGTIFTPSSLNIVAITQEMNMKVTCIVNPITEANIYIPGMLVRLFVPYSYGMYQANNLIGKITEVNGLVFTLNINSSWFDPFVIPSSGEQPASLAPSGSQNLQFDNTTANIVAFQPLNNQGN
jgi:hypothetical protein